MNETLRPAEQTTADTHPLANIERLFGHCFSVERLANQDRLPVGGRSRFSDNLDIEVVIDLDALETDLAKAERAGQNIPLDEVRVWLERVDANVSPELFAKLDGFTEHYWRDHPTVTDHGESRRNFYQETVDPKLSDIINGGYAECAEIAALAQAYCQRVDIKASYVSGDVAHDKNDDFSEEHSYILIQDGQKHFIFDPANPVRSGNHSYPALYEVPDNVREQLRQPKKTFFAAKNILSKQVSYYGVNNGTNINLQRDVIE